MCHTQSRGAAHPPLGAELCSRIRCTVVWFRPEQDLQKWKANAAQPTEQAAKAGEEEEKKGGPEGGAEPRSDGMSLYPETWTKLQELLSESDYSKFHDYVEGLKSGSVTRDTWLVLEEEFTEKERRAKVHQFFKSDVKLYETDTVCKGESRKI